MRTPVNIPLFKVFMAPSVGEKVNEVLYSGYIAEGKKVLEFTDVVQSFIGMNKCVMMNSCTSALTISYRIAGVGPGTEVITTPLTCIASNSPILQLRAKPIWADVDPQTGMITAETIKSCITDKTRAILVLHKEGDPARLKEIIDLAAEHKIKVIEDAAHAFGAKYEGVKIGTHSDFVCFSFQAIKHMTTGDGGALFCKSEEDYSRARKMKWLGIDKFAPAQENPWNADIPEWGLKANMSDLAAAMGIEQMKHIDEIISAHNRNGSRYDELMPSISNVDCISRSTADYSGFWAYTILTENRDQLKAALEKEGVGSAQIHPRNDLYSMFSESKRTLPNVDEFDRRELSLPCGWWMSTEDVDRVCDLVSSFVK